MADLRVVDGADQGPSSVRREYAAELLALQELWDTLPDDVVRRQAVTALAFVRVVIEALCLGRRET